MKQKFKSGIVRAQLWNRPVINSGYFNPYRWYKFVDGTSRKLAVPLNDRVKQVSGTLIIKEAKVEDSGKYLCVVNNSVGGESVETVLTVTGEKIPIQISELFALI
jgi:Immunoglobulin I-set domain